MPRRLLAIAGLILGFSAPLLAQGTFHACYVPVVGAVYMIKLPGLAASCLAPSHQEISWTEGATGPVGGDLTGTLPNLTVSGIRGRAVSPAIPVAGQVLSFDGSTWSPATPSLGGTAGGDLTGAYPNPTVGRLQGRSLAATAPSHGQVLLYDGPSSSWKPSTPPGGVSVHGQLSGLATDDHPQYLLANGTRPLVGTLSAGGNKVTGLAAATAPGDAVRYEQTLKPNDVAGGDLGGAYPSPTVVRLQGRAVSGTAPTNGQALVFDTGTNSWKPTTPASGVSAHAQLSGLGADDHPQYLLANGARALSGNLNAGGNRLTGLGPAATAGDAVRYEQAVKNGDPAGGDLSGTLPNPTVARLQATAVASSAPADGQVLAFDGTANAWRPSSPRPITISSASVSTLLLQTGATVTANCPPGRTAISAGWTGTSFQYYLWKQGRTADGSGWIFEWAANNTPPFFQTVVSTVYCAE